MSLCLASGHAASEPAAANDTTTQHARLVKTDCAGACAVVRCMHVGWVHHHFGSFRALEESEKLPLSDRVLSLLRVSG